MSIKLVSHLKPDCRWMGDGDCKWMGGGGARAHWLLLGKF